MKRILFNLLVLLLAVAVFAFPVISADEELTDWTELNATPANDDILAIVDISDATESTEGT